MEQVVVQAAQNNNMTPYKILGVFRKNSLLLSGLIGIVITMIASSMILSITIDDHQSFARCPNGSHISPSGFCEQVIQPSTGLPRCPNGYHRSPSLDCEPVTPSSNNSPYPNPQQQPQYPPQAQFSQPQLQQGQPLYNPYQVIACLNHVLVYSIVKAGTTPNLTLHNNTKGVAPGLNQTFVQNATNTLDSCIIPMRR
jgi:hypothetical protein